jgi:predicted amidophosphoribosyltransferase
MTNSVKNCQLLQSHYIGCPKCWKPLSIAEQIERHCEECAMDVQPEQIADRRAA